MRKLFCVLSLLLLACPAAAAVRIQEVRTPGGLLAWLVRDPAVPLIAVEFAFRSGGAALDPEGRQGLANFASGLLDEGAGELDALAFQTRLEELAVKLDFSADRDELSGSLQTLTKNKAEAFRLLGLALAQPRFDAEAVERIRAQVLTRLVRDLEDPNTVANRTWFDRAFAGHPYRKPVWGYPETVKAIAAEDLKAFARSRLSRDALVIGVVGDVTAEELGPLLDGAFGTLPAQGDPSRTIAEAAPQQLGQLEVIRRQIPQSAIAFGLPGIKRDDPDWYAGHVMNYVLGGGGFNSRLMEEVREKRGLTYGVYTYLYPLDHAGVWLGGVATQNARVAESLDVIRATLRRFLDEGVTENELADAKTYINGSFPLSLTGSARIARLLISIQRNGLGIDYLDRRDALMNAVTREDVLRVARRLLDPDKLLTVVVGDPKGVGGAG
jgi:zinc protease